MIIRPSHDTRNVIAHRLRAQVVAGILLSSGSGLCACCHLCEGEKARSGRSGDILPHSYGTAPGSAFPGSCFLPKTVYDAATHKEPLLHRFAPHVAADRDAPAPVGSLWQTYRFPYDVERQYIQSPTLLANYHVNCYDEEAREFLRVSYERSFSWKA